MPKMADLKRANQIRSYVRERLDQINSPDDVKNEVMVRFGLEPRRWYSWRVQIRDMIAKHKDTGKNGVIVQEPAAGPEQPEAEPTPIFTIPSDLSDEGKACVNVLLAKNMHLQSEIMAREAQISVLNSEVSRLTARVRAIKSLGEKLWEYV